MSEGCDETILVFDRYIRNSLKGRTRHKRTGGKEVQYVVNNHTNVSNISLKQFLSHIEPKQELTIYLAKHFVSVMERIGKKYVVTYDQVTKTDINEYPRELLQNDHGEADTLIILHAIEVANRNYFCECIISSPDTDIFLLLIHFYEQLCSSTVFRTGRVMDERDINFGECYEAIGPDKAKTILGFYSFTGCDQYVHSRASRKAVGGKLL